MFYYDRIYYRWSCSSITIKSNTTTTPAIIYPVIIKPPYILVLCSNYIINDFINQYFFKNNILM